MTCSQAFFACQSPNGYPNEPVPSRKQSPNWKVQPLLDWMNFLFKTIWLLGVAFSIDEMTIGFQGHHRDKLKINYKAKGDGFQCDALCQEGLQIYYLDQKSQGTY